MLQVNGLVGFGSSVITDPYFINSSVQSSTASASLNVISWSHTTTHDTTCLVIAGSTTNNAGTLNITSVTFNGVALTFADGYTDSLRIYYLLNPPIGTYTITVTASGTNDRFFGAMAANLGAVNELNAISKINTSLETVSTNITTTKRSIFLIASSSGSDNSTIPIVTVTSPSGAVETQTTTNQSNSFGKKTSLFYTPIVAPGTTTVTKTVSNVTLSGFTVVVAAFSI